MRTSLLRIRELQNQIALSLASTSEGEGHETVKARIDEKRRRGKRSTIDLRQKYRVC